jgi:2-oxo-4-hydroxy-4-carboxy-5-ureidoimidazoline decarboxylase
VLPGPQLAAKISGITTSLATVDTTLARFNALPDDEAERELLACCAAPAWACAVAGGRPYPDLAALRAAADTALAALTWPDIVQALAAHPRIGQRAEGEAREAAWSREEQSGMASAEDDTKAALAEANRAYERRFDHVFLISAQGLAPEQMLQAARARLANDEATEREVVRGELAKITRLRLERLVAR